jgi:superfamily II DNA or RNA helicase
MKKHAFQTLSPKIADNKALRVPQREGYEHIASHFADASAQREVGIVLPVGCGKSGLMTIAPFAISSVRVLVIAPSVRIAKQLLDKDFNSTSEELFYKKCAVLDNGTIYPEVAEIRGASSNPADLEEADVVITNIQQLQGTENKWLTALPNDFFDLILVDEGHHNVAASWELLRQTFPAAKIINLSATPVRADGQIMSGDIIYSFPVVRAIQEGYIKRLRAVVLNPASLRFVRSEDGVETEVNRDEVVRLGENDADFRRSILTSKETLDTIVDCSIQQLKALRERTGEPRHKIIAAALNYRHCIQVTEAYQARGLRAAYIHSREEVNTDGVLAKLENNELDVIVQVKKLGEGYDHKWLSVAAVCSVFSNLSPFVQFVGRIMRVAVPNDPMNPNNQGIVVYHAGANVAQRWSDFKDFSEADQAYFDDLFPTEEVFDFVADPLPKEVDPAVPQSLITTPIFEITTQSDVTFSEDELVALTSEQKAAYDLLVEQLGQDQLIKRLELTRLQPRKQEARRAARRALDEEVKNAVGQLMRSKSINPRGRDLDTRHLGQDNFVVLKAKVDKKLAELAGIATGTRGELSSEQIETMRKGLAGAIENVATEL